MKASIIAFVAAVSAAGFAGTVSAAAETAVASAAPGCWTLPAVTHDVESGRGLWTYFHTITWCGDQTSITSTVPPNIEVSTIDDTCVWQGVKSQRTELSATSWSTFSMGEFSCRGENGLLRQVNPWTMITAYPNGSHNTTSGATVGAQSVS